MGNSFFNYHQQRAWGGKKEEQVKESPAQHTKNKSTKDEEKKVFTDHLDIEKFIHTMDHLHD